ncbi:MAG: hypothetical protein WBA74_23355 [Cyclobacteriaceae bacterium]
MDQESTHNRNFLKLTINTFLVCLVLASFVYESSNMTSALTTLQKGEFIVTLTHIVSIVYIAGISTALLMTLHYFGRFILSTQAIDIMKNTGKKRPAPELVVVSPQITRDLISNMQVSKN